VNTVSTGIFDPMKNILLIRLKSIGDVVFVLPAVNTIRDHFPAARITFLTSKENAPLLSGFRAVNDVIPLDRAALRSGNPLRVVPEFFRPLHRLRAGKFSLAVDFQGYGETAWLTWWSGAPERWGSLEGGRRRWAFTLGTTRDYRTHPVEQNLFLLHQCGLRSGGIRNEFILPEAALGEARRFFAAQGLDAAKPTLYLQPFTSSPQKNWPLENYLALGQFWRDRGVQIIFSGGPADRPQLERMEANGFTVAAGIPRLTDAGLMKLSTLIVGGDTGFMHLAVALGKRVLMLIIKAGPGKAVPFGHPDWIVVPSGRPIMEDIGLEQVVLASMSAFSECGVVVHTTGSLPRR